MYLEFNVRSIECVIAKISLLIQHSKLRIIMIINKIIYDFKSHEYFN